MHISIAWNHDNVWKTIPLKCTTFMIFVSVLYHISKITFCSFVFFFFFFFFQNKRKKQSQDSGKTAKKYKEFKFWNIYTILQLMLSTLSLMLAERQMCSPHHVFVFPYIHCVWILYQYSVNLCRCSILNVLSCIVQLV